MIMRPGQPLLLPANPLFIWFSLMLAMICNMVAAMSLGGRAPWLPDLLALALVFWNVHQPLRVGVGVAFMFGLFMDVHQGALLGQHALAYTLMSFLGIAVHRRLLWFSLPNQALQILPLFLVGHLVALAARLLVGGMFPGWSLLLAPVGEALLWPVVALLLLAPQRRAPDPDENRPL